MEDSQASRFVVGVETFHTAEGAVLKPQQSSRSCDSLQGSAEETFCEMAAMPVSVESIPDPLVSERTEQ